jgi:hypothetical protein
MPRILFISSDQKTLDISTNNLKGFHVEYSNLLSKKFSRFYVSNDFDNKDWTIEEIIEFFFDETLEPHLNLKHLHEEEPNDNANPVRQVKKTSRNIEFVHNPNHLKIFGYQAFFMLAFSASLLIIEQYKGIKLPIIIHVIGVLFWLPALILHLSYNLKNVSAKVIIDTKNHDLTYVKNGIEIKFNREDIFRAAIVTTGSGRTIWRSYSYAWFILKDKRYVVITSFIADPHLIVDALNCKFDEETRLIPFLPT